MSPATISSRPVRSSHQRKRFKFVGFASGTLLAQNATQIWTEQQSGMTWHRHARPPCHVHCEKFTWKIARIVGQFVNWCWNNNIVHALKIERELVHSTLDKTKNERLICVESWRTARVLWVLKIASWRRRPNTMNQRINVYRDCRFKTEFGRAFWLIEYCLTSESSPLLRTGLKVLAI